LPGVKWLIVALLGLAPAACGSSTDDRPPATPIEAGTPTFDLPPAIEPNYPDAGVADAPAFDGPPRDLGTPRDFGLGYDLAPPPDNRPPEGQGSLTATWSLNWIGDHAFLGCPAAGVDKLRLQATAVGTAQRTDVDFSCGAGSGTIFLAPARYQVTVSAMTPAGVPVAALQGEFEARANSVTDLGELVFELQSFQLDWTITRGAAPAAIDCTAIDATTVKMRTRMGSEPEVVYTFSCTAGRGVSTAIRIGAYAVGLQLLDSKDAVLWETSQPMAVVVTDTMRAVLPPVTFNLP
jgi:hypothetical protein